MRPVARGALGRGTTLFDVAAERLRPRDDVLTTTLEPTLFQSTVPETEAIVARRVDLMGVFDFARIQEHDGMITVAPSEEAGYQFGGQRYVELPNSTAMTTIDPRTGGRRELVLTRGVRPYENTIDPVHGVWNAPRGYVSDVLLFEREGSKLVYRHTLLRSEPERGFVFEDPRISVLHLKSKEIVYVLSGTDYSPHLPGSSSPDVMNRAMVLELDEGGLPKPIVRPAFIDLSPPPRIDANRAAIYVDAKNGTLAMNEDGEVVLRSRMRFPPDHHYAEQVMVFADLDALKRHRWTDTSAKMKVVATEASFKELYPPSLIDEKPKRGFGPGTIPVRITRRGDQLFISEGKFAPEYSAGTIPPELIDKIPVRDGAAVYLTFDHELRVLQDRRDGGVVAAKRVYTSTLKLWNERLDAIEWVYADAVQPRLPHQRGGSGILDLHHTYPMGRVLVDDGALHRVRVYAGAADAHTESYDFDIVALLGEMSEGSARRASGQVYRI